MLYIYAFVLSIVPGIAALIAGMLVGLPRFDRIYLWSWSQFNPEAAEDDRVTRNRVALADTVIIISSLLVLRAFTNTAPSVQEVLLSGLLALSVPMFALATFASKYGKWTRRMLAASIFLCGAAVGAAILVEEVTDYFIANFALITTVGLIAACLLALPSGAAATRLHIRLALVYTAIVVAGVCVLTHTQTYYGEMLLLAALGPAAVFLLVVLGRVTGYPKSRRRPWPGTISDTFPLDRTVINLLNLSYFLHLVAMKSHPELHSWQTLRELEAAAQDAETELPGPYRRALSSDSLRVSWASDTARQLAEGIRLHKHKVILRSGPEDFKSLRDDLLTHLLAAARRDWNALLVAEKVPHVQATMRRALRVVIPPSILAAAAFVLPPLLGVHADSPAVTGVRISLLVAAVLSLLSNFNPEIGKLPDFIQKAQDKLIPDGKTGV